MSVDISAVAHYRVADPVRSVVAIDVFPAPLMSTIQELSAFLKRETLALGDLPVPAEPRPVAVGSNGGTAGI